MVVAGEEVGSAGSRVGCRVTEIEGLGVPWEVLASGSVGDSDTEDRVRHSG